MSDHILDKKHGSISNSISEQYAWPDNNTTEETTNIKVCPLCNGVGCDNCCNGCVDANNELLTEPVSPEELKNDN